MRVFVCCVCFLNAAIQSAPTERTDRYLLMCRNYDVQLPGVCDAVDFSIKTPRHTKDDIDD